LPDDRHVFVCFDSGRTKVATESVEAWFSKAGEIEGMSAPSVVFSSTSTDETDGFSFVVVVFTNSADADRAVALRWKPLYDSTKSKNKWLRAFESEAVAPTDLQGEANRIVASFEAAETAEEERIKALEGVPDEEGFITVTRKTADRSFESKNLKKKRKLAAEGKVGGGGLQLGPFYKFQIRESKRNRKSAFVLIGTHPLLVPRVKRTLAWLETHGFAGLAELRQKFEEDKQRILKMKQNRKFKPY
jgi:hypothetical protein